MENCEEELISKNEKTAKSNSKRNLLVTAAKKLVTSLHYATEIEKNIFCHEFSIIWECFVSQIS